MPYLIPALGNLIDKGLNLTNYYHENFLYQPLSVDELISQIKGLEKAYLSKASCLSYKPTRIAMISFLMAIVKGLGTVDLKPDRSASWGFFSTFWPVNKKDAKSDADEASKQAKLKQQEKAWILIGAIIYIRYKIKMACHEAWINKHPENSVLYNLLHSVLCPQKKTVKTVEKEVAFEEKNAFVVAHALQALDQFLDSLPDNGYKTLTYFKDGPHRKKQFFDFLTEKKKEPGTMMVTDHLESLAKLVQIIKRFQDIRDQSYGLLEDFEKNYREQEEKAVKAAQEKAVLENTFGALPCSEAVKKVITKSVGLIQHYKETLNQENLQYYIDQYLMNAIVGANLLLQYDYVQKYPGNKDDHKSLFACLNHAISNTRTNSLDEGYSEDIKIIKQTINLYMQLACLETEYPRHKILWGKLDAFNQYVEKLRKEIDKNPTPAVGTAYCI